jgi:hypothetical protein
MVPPPDVQKAIKRVGWVVTSEGDACECASEEDMMRVREMEHAVNRLLLFIVTVLPVVLGMAAWGGGPKV